MKHSKKISIIIPVFNNAIALKKLSNLLEKNLSKKFEQYEVIFINDGSIDNSFLFLTDISKLNKKFKVIDLSKNFGQHPAISAGFDHADGDFIVLMDADLQDDPAYIPLLFDTLTKNDLDVVYTIRVEPNKIISTRLTSIAFHFIFSKIIGTKIPFNIGTFRIFNRIFLDEIKKYNERNILFGPLMFFMGFRSSFLNLKYEKQQSNISSYTFFKRLNIALNSLISYTDIPHKLSTYLGLLILISSITYGIVIFTHYLFFGSSLPGGLTLIVFILCIMLGAIMLILGIIGNYIFRVYQEVLSRPRYHIRKKINFEN